VATRAPSKRRGRRTLRSHVRVGDAMAGACRDRPRWSVVSMCCRARHRPEGQGIARTCLEFDDVPLVFTAAYLSSMFKIMGVRDTFLSTLRKEESMFGLKSILHLSITSTTWMRELSLFAPTARSFYT